MSNRLKRAAVWSPTRATILALVVTLPAVSLAGEYVLQHGNDELVCTEFGRNLHAIGADPDRLNNVCPIAVTEGLADMQAPEWISDEVKAMPTPPGVNVRAKIDRYLWERNANPAQYVPAIEWSKWTGTAEQVRTAFGIFMRQRGTYYREPGVITAFASLDIDNDGQPETVYRDNHNCLYGSVGTTFVVMTRDLSDIDRTKTERILAHPRRAVDAPYFRPLRPRERGFPLGNGRNLDFTSVEDLSRTTNYGAFIYRGKTFVTVIGLQSDVGASAERTLHVYLHDQQGDKEVCTFRFDE
jgi:hypothetical protein